MSRTIDSIFCELLATVNNNKSLPNIQYIHILPHQQNPHRLDFAIMTPNNTRLVFFITHRNSVFFKDISLEYYGKSFTYDDYTFTEGEHNGDNALRAIAAIQNYLEDLASRE